MSVAALLPFTLIVLDAAATDWKRLLLIFLPAFVAFVFLGREIKTSAARRGVYFNDRKRAADTKTNKQTNKRQRQQRQLVHLTNQKPRAFFSHWVLEPITFYSAAAASRMACCILQNHRTRERDEEKRLLALLARLSRTLLKKQMFSQWLDCIRVYFAVKWERNNFDLLIS